MHQIFDKFNMAMESCVPKVVRSNVARVKTLAEAGERAGRVVAGGQQSLASCQNLFAGGQNSLARLPRHIDWLSSAC